MTLLPVMIRCSEDVARFLGARPLLSEFGAKASGLPVLPAGHILVWTYAPPGAPGRKYGWQIIPEGLICLQ